MTLPPYPQDPVYGKRYAVGVDLATNRDLAALVVAHGDFEQVRQGGELEALMGTGMFRQDRRIAVDLVKTWKAPRGGSIDLTEVRSFVAATCRHYGAPAFFDYFQAAYMSDDLRRAGVHSQLVHPTPEFLQRSTMALLNLFRERAIVLPQDESFARELASVSLKEMGPNRYRLGDERDAQGHHDRTSALALAVDALVTQDVNPRPRIVIGPRWAGGRR